MRPDDIPEWAWEKAKDILAAFLPARHSARLPLAQLIAYALMSERAETDRLTAEVERLRTALADILDANDRYIDQMRPVDTDLVTEACNRARAALTTKGDATNG